MAFPETPLPIASELQLGESYLSCGAIATGINAPAGGTVYTPLDVAGHIGSDIDIRVDCAADDWTPTANLVLLAKNYSYGILDDEFSYEFELLTDGRLRLLWSEDGQFGTLTEAYSSVGVGVADRTRVTVRAVMDADIGGTTPQHTVTFYTGPTTNGPWTQLGATQFGAGTTQIAQTTSPIEIGSTNLAQPGFGLVGNFQGKIYKAEVWDAFFGERIVAPDFTRLARGTTEFTDAEGYRWYVYGSSYIRQEWIDATPDTRESENITVSRGLPSEGGGVDTAQCSFTLDNVNGHYSSRNPQGPYYGKLRRNTPHRVSLPAAESALFLKRAVHDYAYTLDSAAISVTGDIDIRVDVNLNAWQGRYTLLLAKSIGAGSGEAGYFFAVNNEGFLHFTWSDDGTDSTETMTANVPVPQPFHGRKTVRVTLDVNNAGNHTAAFYYADSVTATEWTQIGTSVTSSGTTSIYDSDAELWFGGYFSGYDGSEFSRFYAAQVRSGIDGTVVAYPDFRPLAEDTRQFSDAQGNLWKLAGSAEISARDDRHFGAVSEWPQRWDITGTDQFTPATSNGVLRRLGQGQSPLKSTMRRGIQSFGSDLIGYWPLEDEQGATSFASGIPDHPSMVFYGEPTLSTDSTFDASLPLPQLSKSMFVGQIPDYRDTEQEVQAWFLLHIPEAVPDEHAVFRIFTRGSVFGWQLHVDEDGNLRLFAYDPFLNVVLNTGLVAFNVTGKHLRVSIGLRQNGTSIEYRLHTLEVGATTGSFISGNVTSSTLGKAVRVDSGHENILDQVTIGHISVHRVIHSLFDLSSELKAYTGERAGARIYRLCHEEKIPVKVIGSHTDTITMGPQPSATLLDLLTECAEADLGFLHEPRDVLGIAYRTRASMHNQVALGGPKVEFDYSEEQLIGLDPTEDDRYTRNDVTVTRDGGSSARTANDVSNLSVPALSVEEIGRYDDSVTVSLQDDSGLRDQAHWRVHMGTVDEARYPTVSVELGRSEILAVEDLAHHIRSLDVGDLLTITNLPARYPPEDVEQIALGFTETLSAFTHYIDINCAPASPYRVGVYDDPESRYDTQGSILAHDLDATQEFMSVRTITGPVWQTLGDFPFDINVNGERMRVVAVENNTSPQTFLMNRSINGVVKSHPIDSPVSLWRPVYYALGDSPLLGYEAPELPDSPPPEDPDTTVAIRINTGGPAYTGPDGVAWDADRNVTGGTVANQGAPTYGTQHDGMLQTERWGAFTYSIPSIPPGAATVNLYFAENYGATPATPGYRAFDVTLNGVLVADNLDIYAQAGGTYKQLVKSYSTTIPSTGVCTIVFATTGSPNNAAVLMGVEILAEGDAPPVTTGVAPFADIGATTSILKQGSATGGKYKLAGMNVWGITDNVTTSFSDGQYTNRVAICNTIKSWGGNYIRMRLYANYYNGLSAANKTAMINKIVDWRNAARSAGLLFCPCWWDALDGPYNGANWAASNNWQRAFDMMTAVRNALGNDPYTFYEPFNEPNNVTDANWQTAMQSTIAHFRSTGYTGLLVIDTTGWSHNYSDTYMTNIETYDASVNESGRANIAFAMHDYGNEFPSDTWSDSYWTDNRGGAARDHILIETEFGAYNTGETVLPWAQDACEFFAATMQTQDNFSGAAPFLFGPWLDNNAITTSDNVTTTTWGGYAKNDFLADASATPVPPYTAIPDPPPPDPDDPIVTPYGWFSGVVRPSIAGQYTQSNVDFWNTNFRGVEVSATLTYTVRTGGWGDLVNPGYVLGNWTNPNLTVIIAQPMVPNSVAAKGAQAEAINTGAYDGYWRTWGNSINAYVARGMPEPITEIAWEFNGDWMYHSAFNAAAFRTAFARIVTQIRTTRPSAKIAWTVNAGYSQNPPSHNAQDCYPGDAYVDYIGVDIYDHYPRAVGYAAINNRENTNTGRAKYWEAFADAHNKGMVFPEWGLQNATNKQAYGGGDNPDWMSWFWDWCQHLKSIGLMVAEVYFDEAVETNVRSTLLQPPLNANSRARYLSLW